MTYTRLALTAVALAGSLHMAQAQALARQTRPHAALAADQPSIQLAEMMGGMGQQGGSSQPGAAPMAPGMQAQPGSPPHGMPMMDDKMRGQSSGGMPMMDDKMGGGASGGMQPMGQMMQPMGRMMQTMGRMMQTMGTMTPPSASMPGMMTSPSAHLEGRIAFLQAELGITDAQMPQWHAFADAMRSAAKSMQAAMAEPAAGMPVSAPERGEREVKLLTARLEGMRTVHAAGQALYAVLSDNQKKIADELMAGPMSPM